MIGRGAWFCRSDVCTAKLTKKNILERAFGRRVESSPAELLRPGAPQYNPSEEHW
jgi:predicted RNA-binding protein YlxR (DUF448 family)